MSQQGTLRKPLVGILAPVVSTFDTWQGALSSDPFVANIAAHLADGVAGIVVAASTGEAVLLTEEERARLVSWARDAVPADRWLIMGTGAESTSLTIQRTQAACQRGADAVLVVPPHYYGAAMTREALANHYWHIVDESACPVVLYNSPRFTHVNLEPELVHALAAHENVIGIKDGGTDEARFTRYLEAQSPRFSVLCGNGSELRRALRMGARGGVIASALFAAELALAVYAGGDEAAVADAQARMTEITARVVSLGPAGVKAAMDAVGRHGGPVRSPLLPLRPSELADVVSALRAAGLLAAV